MWTHLLASLLEDYVEEDEDEDEDESQ